MGGALYVGEQIVCLRAFLDQVLYFRHFFFTYLFNKIVFPTIRSSTEFHLKNIKVTIWFGAGSYG